MVPIEFHRRDSVNGTHSAKSPEPQVLAVSLLQITGQYQSSAPQRLWRLEKKNKKLEDWAENMGNTMEYNKIA